MSTRSVFSFLPKLDRSNEPAFHVYKHSDGYPSGAAAAIAATLPYAFPLPRYENDEFAGAFVAGCKAASKASQDEMAARGYVGLQGGNIRLLATGPVRDVSPCDIEYRYEISVDAKGKLRVVAFEVNAWEEWTEKQIFAGTFPAFVKKFKDY